MEKIYEEKQKCLLRGIGEGYPEALVGNPLFCWSCFGVAGVQEKYRIQVWNAGQVLYWDSSWVESDQSDNILYEGRPLEYDSDYVAKVSVLTSENIKLESEPESFSTGLERDTWKGQWLKPCEPEAAAPLFRKEFTAREKIVRARLYLCGLGYQEAYVNGHRAGDDDLSPAWTDYSKRVSYVSYDIKEYLNTGTNVIGIMLGKGWYGKTEGMDIGKLLFSCQISIEYESGEKEWIYSKGCDGWLVNSNGPVKADSIYIGEVYDARCEVEGWDLPGTICREEDGWLNAIVTEPPKGRMVPQNVEEIACVTRLLAVSVTEPEEGCYVIDFGQNLAGIIEAEFDEPKGTEISIRYSEILHPDGTLNTANLRTAQAKDVYISNGTKGIYRSRFTYHGFRYAEIRGVTGKFPAEKITALALRNRVEKRGQFECGNDLVNKIQKMCVWTESNNMHGVPTDCPQRDERLGWLNDLTVRAEEAVYNFDLQRFYRKFLQDIRDAQGEKTGAITDTVPFTRYGNQPADPVCSSYLILGWLLYWHYGDVETLETFYEGFSAWTDFLAAQTEEGIVNYSYYGDWASPVAGSIAGSYGSGAVSKITPGGLMSTGFLYYDAVLMEKMAEILGKQKDLAKWQSIKLQSERALNKTFFHEETGSYASDSQAANTFMAWLGISPEKDKTVDAIVKDIYAHNIHMTTGNICSRYILEVLTENGYVDLAYALVTQTTYPSWGYMVEKGATTTWERWESVESGPLLGMASHDHPMYSTVSAWFYRYLLGILPAAPGFSTFRIKPYIPRKLPWAKGHLNTIKGTIPVEWHQTREEILTLQITVPFNTKCQLIIPEGFSQDWTLNETQLTGDRSLTAGCYTAVYKRTKGE